MWTKERMQSLLATNDLAVERALVALYDRQTHDEKANSRTRHDNARGFRKNHDSVGSYYARIILKGWKTSGKNRIHLNPTHHPSLLRGLRGETHMSRDPEQVFVVRSFTRREIAEEFNNIIDGDSLKIEPFKEDDDRLTDEVCQAFTTATEEAIVETDDVVDTEYAFRRNVVELYFK